MRIALAGGWGYENLGDEAILAGYLESLSPHFDLTVTSRGPARTSDALRAGLTVQKEHVVPDAAALVLGGGGYLNGSWMPEIVGKLSRLRKMAEGRPVIAHAVEVRRMHGSLRRRPFRSIFGDAAVAVRDHESLEELKSLGLGEDAQIVPDGISLLVPHLDRYRVQFPGVSNKVVLNLLDISHRTDSDEAEIDARSWDDYVRTLVEALGDKALGLVGGEGDRAYITSIAPKLPLIEPMTVGDMVSILGSAEGVVSVRMHPSLLAAALGTPVVAIPYCGKVRPTLTKIGVDEIIQPNLEVEETMSRLSGSKDWKQQWSRATHESENWLHGAIDQLVTH